MFFLLGPLMLYAQTPAPDFAALDEEVARELKASGIPGAALAVVQGDRVVYLKGYGEASVETKEKVHVDTLFRIGSTTKMFTAAAVLSLVEEGKLDLSKPLSTYVNGIHPKLGVLTGHQLLSHTAGLGDRGSGTGSHDDDALGEFIRGLDPSILELPPGAIYSYSSLGYWTAGFLLESVAGTPFADAVGERVFAPIGMTGSTFRPLMAMTYPLAQQHEGGREKAPALIRPFADQAASWPGGSAFASARGLSRFMVAFLNGGRLEGKQVLPAAVVQKMSMGHARLPGSEDSFYTYGLVLGNDRGVRTLSHGGARIGYGSMLVMAPDQKVGVAVVANRSNAMLHSVAGRAMEMLVKFGPQEPSPEPLSAALPAETVSKYVGTYAGGPIRIQVSAAEGVLQVTMDGKTQAAKSLGKDQFLAEGPVGYFVFVSDAHGAIRYLHTNLRTLARVP